MRDHVISIIGTKSSGKTSFFKFLELGRYEKAEFHQEADKKTVDSGYVVLTSSSDSYRIEFTDGDIEDAEGYIILYDPDSENEVEQIIKTVDKPMVFVRNKQDYFDIREKSVYQPCFDYSTKELDNPTPIIKEIIEKISKKIVRGRLQIVEQDGL